MGYLKMNGRHWISRNEIAEIHEAIARKELNGFVKTAEVSASLDHADDHLNRAQTIRQIDNIFAGRR